MIVFKLFDQYNRFYSKKRSLKVIMRYSILFNSFFHFLDLLTILIFTIYANFDKLIKMYKVSQYNNKK